LLFKVNVNEHGHGVLCFPITEGEVLTYNKMGDDDMIAILHDLSARVANLEHIVQNISRHLPQRSSPQYEDRTVGKRGLKVFGLASPAEAHEKSIHFCPDCKSEPEKPVLYFWEEGMSSKCACPVCDRVWDI
jgi:hypothetical protein